MSEIYNDEMLGNDKQNMDIIRAMQNTEANEISELYEILERLKSQRTEMINGGEKYSEMLVSINDSIARLESIIADRENRLNTAPNNTSNTDESASNNTIDNNNDSSTNNNSSNATESDQSRPSTSESSNNQLISPTPSDNSTNSTSKRTLPLQENAINGASWAILQQIMELGKVPNDKFHNIGNNVKDNANRSFGHNPQNDKTNHIYTSNPALNGHLEQQPKDLTNIDNSNGFLNTKQNYNMKYHNIDNPIDSSMQSLPSFTQNDKDTQPQKVILSEHGESKDLYRMGESTKFHNGINNSPNNIDNSNNLFSFNNKDNMKYHNMVGISNISTCNTHSKMVTYQLDILRLILLYNLMHPHNCYNYDMCDIGLNQLNILGLLVDDK